MSVARNTDLKDWRRQGGLLASKKRPSRVTGKEMLLL
jgi:hypothetical protein